VGTVAQGQRDAEDLRFQGINEVPNGRGDFYVYTALCLLEKHPRIHPFARNPQSLKFFGSFFGGFKYFRKRWNDQYGLNG